LIVNGHH
jgi:hypothetical protein